MEFRSWRQRGLGDRPSPVEVAEHAIGSARAPSFRNTSQNEVAPFICLSGRTSTPGWCMSMGK